MKTHALFRLDSHRRIAAAACCVISACCVIGAGCSTASSPGDAVDDAAADDALLTQAGGVHIAASAAEAAGITVGVVTSEPLQWIVRAPAEVTLNPDRVAHVTSLVSGQIEDVRVSLGDHVVRGQLLATLRSITLGETRAAARGAQAWVDVAHANFTRHEELQKEGIGSRRALLEAEGDLRKAQAELEGALERLQIYGASRGSGNLAPITSPLDGVITHRHATPGEVVSPKEPMFMVANLARVWVVGRLYEKDIAAACLNAQATVTLHAYPDRAWKAAVSYVASVLDTETRTLPVRVELDNPDGMLRPGLFGELALAPPANSQRSVATVPDAAVTRWAGKDAVFVPTQEAEIYELRPVIVGVRGGVYGGGRVEIVEGLREGDRVVTAGAFTLKSELLKRTLGEAHGE